MYKCMSSSTAPSCEMAHRAKNPAGVSAKAKIGGGSFPKGPKQMQSGFEVGGQHEPTAAHPLRRRQTMARGGR